MNARVIKVAFANPPKAGKKLASIKTDDGDILGVWMKDFGLFQRGRSYRVEFSEREYQGRQYKTVTKCEPVEDDKPAAQRAPGSNDELEFVTRVLSASIAACVVPHNEQALVESVRMLRSVYRKAMI